MNVFCKSLLALTMIATAVPASADDFRSRVGARVNQVNAVVFEVIPRGRSSGQAIWCSAGDYAQRRLGAPWAAIIYVVRGRGESVTTGRRTAVQFTMDPNAAGVAPAAPSLSLNSFRVGDNMSVQLAFSHCSIPPPRF